MSDLELLRRCRAGDGEALAALAERHYGWVYAAARRQVGDAHVAEDVAQAVFIVLMRKAPALRSDSVLAAWLFQVTRFAAKRALRSQRRREFHEGRAGDIRPTRAVAEDEQATWDEIQTQVDDALSRLGGADREAVLLRFYQGRTFVEVGSAMGISEEAARKRVTRALDRLRDRLSSRGVSITTATLGPAMLKLASDAAAVKVSAIAQAGAVSGALAKGMTGMITMTATKLMAAVAVAVLLTAATTGVVLRLADTYAASRAAALPPATMPTVEAISQSGPMLTDDLLQIGIADLLGPGVITHMELRVDGNGQVSPPRLQVTVKGASVMEAESKIHDAYRAANFIANADISIRRMESGTAPSMRSGPAQAGDWLRIDIVDIAGPGVTTEVTVQLSDRGEVSIPLIGIVKLAGQSDAQISSTLVKAYRTANLIPKAIIWVLKITPQQAALVPKERILTGRG